MRGEWEEEDEEGGRWSLRSGGGQKGGGRHEEWAAREEARAMAWVQRSCTGTHWCHHAHVTRKRRPTQLKKRGSTSTSKAQVKGARRRADTHNPHTFSLVISSAILASSIALSVALLALRYSSIAANVLPVVSRWLAYFESSPSICTQCSTVQHGAALKGAWRYASGRRLGEVQAGGSEPPGPPTARQHAQPT